MKWGFHLSSKKNSSVRKRERGSMMRPLKKHFRETEKRHCETVFSVPWTISLVTWTLGSKLLANIVEEFAAIIKIGHLKDSDTAAICQPLISQYTTSHLSLRVKSGISTHSLSSQFNLLNATPQHTIS